MYLSTSHPGINTSPQPRLEENETPNSKRLLKVEQIPQLHYDGDESDGDNIDPDEFGAVAAADGCTSGSELYSRHQASSLPDLVASMSTSTYSLQQEEFLAEGVYADVSGVSLVAPTPTPVRPKKKRRKRRSESEIESPSKIRGGGSPLTIAKSRGGGSPSFLASTPIQPGPQLVEIPPLRAHWDLGNSIGRRRGVCGCNSSPSPHQPISYSLPSSSDTSYLDVTLFTLFYFSDQFDTWILDEKVGKGFPTPTAKEVRSLLRKEVLYSLRTAYYCPSLSVGRLFQSLFPSSKPYTLEYSRFFRHFLEKVLTLPETTHYTNGTSRLIHLLHGTTTTTASGSTMTVQQLFEQNLGDMKLLSVPQPGLFLAVENPLVVPHPVLLPNMQLDLGRTLIQLSDDNDTGDGGGSEIYNFHKPTSSSPTSTKNEVKSESYIRTEIRFCKWLRSVAKVVYEYLQNLVEQLPAYGIENSSNFNQSLISTEDSIEDSWSVTPNGDHQPYHDLEESLIGKRKGKKKSKGKLTLALDLMAVICLQHSSTYQHQYTAFVRCGQNPRRGWAPWVHFTPCDQGTPLVRRVEDLGKWLNRLEKRPGKVKSLWNVIPSDVQNLLTSSTFFIYTPKPDYESQNTLFSYVNEC